MKIAGVKGSRTACERSNRASARRSREPGPVDRVEFESPTLTRKPIPDSFIVVAPRSSNLPATSSEEVLGTTKDSAFLLVESSAQVKSLQDGGMVAFPNYEYEGELYDRPLEGSDDTRESNSDTRESNSDTRESNRLPSHLEIIDIKSAWAVTRGNPDVLSAVTDSGPDLEHPSLAKSSWNNRDEVAGNGIDDDGNGKVDDVFGWDFSDNDNDPASDSGRHHTHILGLVHAEKGRGVSGLVPGAKSMSLKIAGGERRFSSAMLVESYLYALENGAKSVNTSFNIDGFVGDRAIEATYRELTEGDVLLFNSAGNAGRRDPKRTQFEDVVLVASTKTAPEERDVRSEFSNYGDGIDISAPGTDVFSTLPGDRVGSLSGTSMASPQVLGVDLLIQSAHPDWNRAQRWAQIAGTTDAMDGSQGEDGQMGFGRLNAGRALNETLPAPTVTPKLTTFPNGQTMNVLVRFDKVLEPEAANHPEAWRILNEEGEVVRTGPPKEVRLMTNQLDFKVWDLPKGEYTLVGSAEHLRDPFGRPLDGNGDGVPGDDLVVPFQRIS